MSSIRTLTISAILCLSYLSGNVLQSLAVDPIPICGAPGFDIGNLTKPDAWTFTGNVCLPVNQTAQPTCTFSMAFCKPLPPSSGCMANASICQSSSEKFTLGTHVPNAFNLTMPSGITGYRVEFGPGSQIPLQKNSSLSCRVMTTLTFLCNFNEAWPRESQSPSPSPPKPPTKLTFDPETCQYNITFEFAGACPQFTPAQQPTQLSAGSVLLILFFVCIIIYLSFGSMYKIATGSHGKDIIPNADFWSELPLYIRDGCVFACSCGQTVSNKTYESI